MEQEDRFQLGIKAWLLDDKSNLLLLKVNTLLGGYDEEPYWDIPGGRIHVNETIKDTLSREVLEETNLSIKSFEFFHAALSSLRLSLEDGTTVGLVLFIYKCEFKNDRTIELSDEHTEYRWFPPGQAGELLRVKYPEDFVNRLVDIGPAKDMT